MYSEPPPSLTRSTTDVDRRLGIRIRTRRLELEMSQEKLAEAIGVTFQQVQKYEKGVNRVAVSTLVEILAALQISPAHFLEGVAGESNLPVDNFAADTFALIKAFSSIKSAGKRTSVLSAVKALVGQP